MHAVHSVPTCSDHRIEGEITPLQAQQKLLCMLLRISFTYNTGTRTLPWSSRGPQKRPHRMCSKSAPCNGCVRSVLRLRKRQSALSHDPAKVGNGWAFFHFRSTSSSIQSGSPRRDSTSHITHVSLAHTTCSTGAKGSAHILRYFYYYQDHSLHMPCCVDLTRMPSLPSITPSLKMQNISAPLHGSTPSTLRRPLPSKPPLSLPSPCPTSPARYHPWARS